MTCDRLSAAQGTVNIRQPHFTRPLEMPDDSDADHLLEIALLLKAAVYIMLREGPSSILH